MEPHGADRVETAADGGLWLICRESKGWTGRRGRTLTQAEYPGTAVRWESDLFEVVDVFSHPDGTLRYRLAPWQNDHAVRAIRIYDAGSETECSLRRQAWKKSVGKRRLALLLSPILGHLPGRVQQDMESEFGAPAVAMTIVSALPLFTLGAVSLLFWLAAAYGAALGLGSTGGLETISRILPLPIALYLTGESAVRLAAAFSHHQPTGSIPGVLFYELWRRIGKPHGKKSA